MAYQEIIFEKEKGVATITLNRTEKLNALNRAEIDQLLQALSQIKDDLSIRAVILTGAGRGFCSGYDVTMQAARFDSDGAQERRKVLSEPILSVPPLMRRLEQPVIGAINGIAAGGGLALALACDICLASERARFSSVFVRRALVPDCGTTYFLTRAVGTAKACELAFTGDIIDAQEALRLGMVSRVVPHDELMGQARELATKLAKGPPLAIGLTKHLLYQGASNGLTAQMVREMYAQSITTPSEDHKEGVRAFLEKREPDFKGR